MKENVFCMMLKPTYNNINRIKYIVRVKYLVFTKSCDILRNVCLNMEF